MSASMQRAASPDRTAPSALPWEWMTPFGGPLLPDVNMIASVSLSSDDFGHWVDHRAAVDPCELIRCPHLAQRRQVLQFRPKVVEIAVATELLHRHQELHGGDAELRDELRGLQ